MRLRHLFLATTLAAASAAFAATPSVQTCPDHSMALASDGKVYEWGDLRTSIFYQRFDFGYPVPFSSIFTREGITNVRSIACTIGASLVVREDDTVWAYGYNFSGVLGRDVATTPSSFTPGPIIGLPLTRVISVSQGVDPFVVAIDRSGALWGWGDNSHAQLASPASAPNQPYTVPVLMVAAGVVSAAAGWQHTVGVDSSGNVYVRGRERASLGNIVVDHPDFERVMGLPPIAQVFAGGFTSFAISRVGGDVYAWGDNTFGQLGIGLDGPPGAPSLRTTPVRIEGLPAIKTIASSGGTTFAIAFDGSVWGWGINDLGQLGLGSADPLNEVRYPRPVRIPFPGTPLEMATGTANSLGLAADGAAFGWGWNAFGRIGDGTFANRFSPTPVLAESSVGAIDLTPENPLTTAAGRAPPIEVIATGTRRSQPTEPLTASAELRPRAQDRSAVANTYVFALAPTSMVKNAPEANAARKVGETVCTLAQLDPSGQLRAVSESGIQPYTSQVVLGQSQTVAILNGVPTGNVDGAIFFAGYGASPGAMLSNGTHHSAVSPGGSGGCAPQAPQTGWWWNAAEGGRGYSIEKQGNNLFMAAYFYEANGRATWLVAGGPISLDGSRFVAPLYAAAGGTTLSGAYKPNTSTAVGQVTLTFTDASHGTMTWPGGTVGIERFNIVPNGLAAAPQANQPESGWWWNAAENGRGFFIEWQGGSANIAGYMYDDAGNPIWYITVATTPNPLALNSSWWQYANGQTMTGAYRPPTQINGNVGPATIVFHTATTATMTLPGGRQIPLVRFRF